MLHRVAVIVPSLDPPDTLPGFIKDLVKVGLTPVVVDDGSGPGYAPIFDEIKNVEGAILLSHSSNLGKGRALKTGFEYSLEVLDVDSVVTADSDGQHTVEDILLTARSISEHPAHSSQAVLGVRDFDHHFVPKKSAAGNKITSRVVQVLFGRHFKDTQTGLRGFTSALLPLLLRVRGDRFEYEMNMLLRLVHEQVRIKEIPILTVYNDIENSHTHFRPLVDSLRIYAVIFKQFFLFVSSSLAGSAVDLLMFAVIINLVFNGTHAALAVTVATVAARVSSAVVNFFLNREAVFHDRSSRRRGIIRYASLAVGLVTASALGVSLLAPIMGGHVVWAKIIIDCLLFVVSFLVQKRWVFADKTDRLSDAAPKLDEDPIDVSV